MEKTGVAVLAIDQPEGKRVLQLIHHYENVMKTEMISGHSTDDLIVFGKKYHPNIAVVENDSHYKEVDDELWQEDVNTYAGPDAIAQSLENENIHLVYNGYKDRKGLQPSLFALKAGKSLLLPNTFALLETGNLFREIAEENNAFIIPFDPFVFSMWYHLQSLDMSTVHSITLCRGNNVAEGYFLSCLIALLKLLPQLHQIDISTVVQSGEENYRLFICKKDGAGITVTEPVNEIHSYSHALLFPRRAEDKSHHFDLLKQVAFTEEGPHKAEICKKFASYDYYSLASSGVLEVKNSLTIAQLENVIHAISPQKITTLKDVRAVLKSSSRID